MWRYLLLAPVYLLSTSLPLASATLANLEYEYALVCAYLALLLIPLAGLLLPELYLPEDAGRYSPSGPLEFFWVCLVSPLIALLPAAYAHLAQLCACSPNGTGFWMLVQWYPTWILAHAAMHLVMRLRVLGFTKLRIGLGYGAIALVLTLFAVIQLWIHPQKRLVNLFTGFWHGPVYDEWIDFDAGLMLARSSHMLLALGLLFLTWIKRENLRKQWVLGSAIVICLASYASTAALAHRFPSTRNGKAALDKLLDQTIDGDGFTLRWRRQENDGAPTPARIQRLVRDTQFHVAELRQILGGDALPKVQIYVYPSDDKKKLWFGGGATDVADVRTPSIHVTDDSWPHPTLRHELVHAMTSGFAFHGLGFHPNMAFTEGLAVALAPDARSLSLDDGAAGLLDSGRLPPLEDLFTPAFWKVSGGRAYTVAGSLIRHMIKTHGFGGVRALYSGASWKEAFKEDQKTSITKWKETISAGYDQEKHAIFSEALFRYPGVLNDICPHSKADLARSRNDGVFTRMRQPIGWDPERDYLPWLSSLDPDDQQTRLRLWRKEIRQVATDRFAAEGRLATWRETVQRARVNPPKTLEDAELALLDSDLARLTGDRHSSTKILDELAQFSAQHYLGDGLTRELQARRTFETTLAPEQAFEWRRYLAGWRRALPEGSDGSSSWLVSYLRLRNDRAGHLTEAELIKLLELTPAPELAKTFHFEWYKLLGHRLMRSGAYHEAHTAYAQAAESAAPGSKDLYAEHARRASYFAQLGPLTTEAAESHSSL